MFKHIAFALVVAFMVLDYSEACTPNVTTPATARRRRDVDGQGITVAVSTLYDFDEAENAGNIAALGQQLKQLAKSQQLDLSQFGEVKKTAENENGHLRVNYATKGGNCDYVKSFVPQAVQLSPVVQSATVSCNGETTEFDKQ